MGYISPSYTSTVNTYLPFTSDAHIGVLLMIVAAICIGVSCGLQLNRSNTDIRSCAAKSIYVSALFYYTGALMIATTLPMVGLYAYFTFAVATLIGGFAIAFVVAIVWTYFCSPVLVFLTRLLCVTSLWSDHRIQVYCRERISTKNELR